MRGRGRYALIRRGSAPAVALLLGVALAGGAEAAPGTQGAVAGIARAVAVSAPVAASARLMVEVQPGDAVVYLDGRLLGSGAQLANLHSPLVIDPGGHRLEVTRPGYTSAVREFEATKGQDVSLRIELRQE